MDDSKIRVLLVDDSDIHVRALLAVLAEHADLEVIGRGRTGSEGIRLGHELAADVVLLDLSLPDVSGWQVADALREARPRLGIVIWSQHDTPAHRELARDRGALFLSKCEGADELVAALRARARVRENACVCTSDQFVMLDELVAQVARDTSTLVAVDCAGRIQFASSIAIQFLGTDPAGVDLFELVHLDDVARIEEVLDSTPSAGTSLTFRLQTRRGWRWVDAHVSRSTHVTVFSLCDVTELQLTIERLAHNDRLLREITDAIDAVFWMTDVAKEQMIYVSPAYERLWGRPRALLYAAPRSWLECVHPVDRERVREAALSQQSSGCYDVEYRIIRPDGEVRWIRDRAFPLFDRNGAVHRIAGVASDITEHRQLVQRLEDAEMLGAVGRLARSIAHDFNNMLAVVALNATDLVSDPACPDGFREPLGAIMEATESAGALTRHLTAFASRHASGTTSTPTRIDLGDAMTRLVRLAQRLLGKDIAVRCKIATDAPQIAIVPALLDQVILNLLVNARDAMPDGGSIELCVEASMRGDTRTPWAALVVRDTGQGIAAEHLPRIFEPHFTTKGPDKGSGLGLATVHEIVTSNGGAIEVASQLGEGTEFRIFWPGCT